MSTIIRETWFINNNCNTNVQQAIKGNIDRQLRWLEKPKVISAHQSVNNTENGIKQKTDQWYHTSLSTEGSKSDEDNYRGEKAVATHPSANVHDLQQKISYNSTRRCTILLEKNKRGILHCTKSEHTMLDRQEAAPTGIRKERTHILIFNK